MELSTVHKAMSMAATEVLPKRGTDTPMGTYAIRAPTDEIDQVREICERQGITLSSYLRWCCKLLLEDMKP